MLPNTVGKSPIRVHRVELSKALALENMHRLGTAPSEVVVSLANGYAEAPTVHVVQDDVDDPQARLPYHPVDLGKRVVLNVLVADRVIPCRVEHRRQIALLEMPYSIICQDRFYLS